MANTPFNTSIVNHMPSLAEVSTSLVLGHWGKRGVMLHAEVDVSTA